MISNDKEAAKFYCTFKVHKPHEPMTAPPPRPIVSGSGSVTGNIAAYVQHHIKEFGQKFYVSFLLCEISVQILDKMVNKRVSENF